MIFKDSIVGFKRQKLNSKMAYCCRKSSMCKYYIESSCVGPIQTCTILYLNRGDKTPPKKVMITSLYHICSYINHIKSIYFYAPEKIISI